jgi:hypothetical protein
MRTLSLILAFCMSVQGFAADAPPPVEKAAEPAAENTEATTQGPDCGCRASIYPEKFPESVLPASTPPEHKDELLGPVPKKETASLSSVNWGNILVGGAALLGIGGLTYLAYKSYKDNKKAQQQAMNYYNPYPTYRTYLPPYMPGGSPYNTQYYGYTPWGSPMYGSNYNAMLGTGLPPAMIYSSPLSVGSPYTGQAAYMGTPPAVVAPVYYTNTTVIQRPVSCPVTNYFGTGVPLYTSCY